MYILITILDLIYSVSHFLNTFLLLFSKDALN